MMGSVDEIGQIKVNGNTGTIQNQCKLSTFKNSKLAKQNGVDEEELSNSAEKTIDQSEKDSVKSKSNAVLRNVATENYNQQNSLMGQAAKSKFLVRSQAFSTEDDAQLTCGLTPLSRVVTAKSAFISTKSDSINDRTTYTDSTGINLLSFITSTLHKNVKDRSMLLQLEENMRSLVNDSMRNSLKFAVMSSYNRMLVHRVAAFFGLSHNVDQAGTAVVVNKTSLTRLPEIEFSSLIQSDTFTDEPRRFLRKDTQSYDETRYSLSVGEALERRSRSFEVSDCQTLGDTAFNSGCAPLPLHIIQQQGSTCSTDASSNQLLESPGSCYSYGEMPLWGIYSPVSENGTAQIIPWSSSESYNSSIDFPSNLMPPIMNNQGRAPMLTRGMSVDVNISPAKVATNCTTLIEQNRIPNRRSNTENISPREPLIPEHASVQLDEQQPASQLGIVGGFGRCRPYPFVPNYAQYSPATSLACQKLSQQMEGLCVTDHPETVTPNQPYIAPGQAVHPIYQQQYLVPSQSTVCSPQPYFVPCYPGCHVLPALPSQPIYPMYTNYPILNYGCTTPTESDVTINGQSFNGSTAGSEKLPNY